MKRLIISLVLALVATLAWAQLGTGKLKGLDDQDHTLAEYIGQGKWTLVNVWSTSCPYCRQEMPDLQEFHDQHKDKDATVLGVAIAFPSFAYPKPAVVKQYVNDYFIDFPNLLADAEQIAALLDQPVEAIPLSFFYDPQGQLIGLWQGTLDRQLIERVMQTGELEKN